MKLIKLNRNSGWFGISKWGLVIDNIIVGQIARKEGYANLGKKAKVYTAFYPNNEEWMSKEFLKFRDALNWLKGEIKEKWEV